MRVKKAYLSVLVIENEANCHPSYLDSQTRFRVVRFLTIAGDGPSTVCFPKISQQVAVGYVRITRSEDRAMLVRNLIAEAMPKASARGVRRAPTTHNALFYFSFTKINYPTFTRLILG